MSNLSVHLDNYLKLRRQLGFKLKCEANLLHNFLRFAEGKRARFITTKLALEWAIEPANIQAERRATRLGVVRRFAKYVSSMDPRTEVPSPKLLPGQFRRRPPYLYQNDDIRRLISCRRGMYLHAERLLAKAGVARGNGEGYLPPGVKRRAERSGGLHKRSAEDWGDPLRRAIGAEPERP